MACKTNAVEVIGPVAILDVSTRKYPNHSTQVDTVDLSSVLDGKGRWFAHRGTTGGLYVKRGQRDLLHRHLLNLPTGRVPLVDHVDRDGMNNRRSNLRQASEVGIGYFDTAEAAARAYDTAARAHFGEFAFTNFGVTP